ncbi:serine protease easter [Cherax quadricarinatus]|nr:serine protease easter-like [Cherax quadricarinatus]
MTRPQVMVMVIVQVMVMASVDAQSGTRCIQNKGQQGMCGPITTCPPLLSLLRQLRSRNPPKNGSQTLISSFCGYEGSIPLVCCPVNSSTAISQITGRSLLPSRCGISLLTQQIIDGEDASLLAWPWMVLLRGRTRGVLTWTCGGVLISERYVLTAAHCNDTTTTLESVRVGEHTLNINPDCEKGVCAPAPQDILVERIISHPDYKKPCNKCNDIALLRLSRPAVLNPIHVVPICLPVDLKQQMGITEDEFLDKHAWAAGWGSISRDSSVFIRLDTLQQVQLPITNSESCEIMRSSYPDPRMVLCAGGEGKDTCSGDSGGPLTLTNKGNTKHFVVGITSHGPSECGITNTQGIYTNVHYYVQWIIDNLQP